jgi:hypothetical protein
MKTVIDIVDSIYQLINVGSVLSTINGGVYADGRPDGSRKEDIVINCLPVTGEQLQRGVVNINCHAPNLSLTIDDQPDNSQPNRNKLKQMADAVILIVKDAIIDDMVTSVENVMMIEEENIHEHYVNIRVAVNSINI